MVSQDAEGGENEEVLKKDTYIEWRTVSE